MNRVVFLFLLLPLSQLAIAQQAKSRNPSKAESLIFKTATEPPPKLDSLPLSEPFDADKVLSDKQEERHPGVWEESMPEFPGGSNALLKFISSNLRYPEEALKQDIAGTVYVSFVVSKEGSIKEVTVVKGIDPECNKEAVRLVSSMPDWKPGKQNGRTIAVRYSLPIRFYPPEKK